MKKAKGKLKTDYRVFSPPYFETPVSRNDEGFLEVISSPRLWFQVSCKYLKGPLPIAALKKIRGSFPIWVQLCTNDCLLV